MQCDSQNNLLCCATYEWHPAGLQTCTRRLSIGNDGPGTLLPGCGQIRDRDITPNDTAINHPLSRAGTTITPKIDDIDIAESIFSRDSTTAVMPSSLLDPTDIAT